MSIVLKQPVKPRDTPGPDGGKDLPAPGKGPGARFHGLAIAVAAFTLLGVFFAAGAREAGAEWFGDAGVSAVYDNSLNGAKDRADKKADIAAVPRVSLRHHAQPGGYTGITATAELEDAVFARYSGLDHVEAGLRVELKQKVGLGSYAPWLKAFGSAAYYDYREKVRSGGLDTAGIAVGKRLGERVFAQLGYAYEDGRVHNSAFDVWGRTFSIKGDYLLTESTHLSLGYAFRRGTIMVSDEDIGENARKVVVVDTFHTPMNMIDELFDTTILSIGAMTELDKNLSAVISLDYYEDRQIGFGEKYSFAVSRVGIRYAF